MASYATGFVDSYQASRLNWLTGTTYPAVPAGNFLGLYIGKLPATDGTGASEATGTRPAITLGSPTSVNGSTYITHAAAVSNIACTNASAGTIVGFGIYAAATGGTPLYIGPLPSPFPVAANATVSIPAGAIKVFSEPNTASLG